jgi:hypothetical protein
MPQIQGTVYYRDGSPGAGLRVSGLVAGVLGGMTGTTHTDSRGRFTLSWTSSTRTLAKVYVNGDAREHDVADGADVVIRLP